MVDLELLFHFRNKQSSCKIFTDISESPCFIFTILLSKDLIEEFGDEVTIKTDLEKVLQKADDYPALVELRCAIFESVRKLPEFNSEKAKYRLQTKTPPSPVRNRSAGCEAQSRS